MLKIGLTGGICSGKSTVSDLFKNLYSISIIDADEISRNLLTPNSPAFNEVIELFGHQAILHDKQLNRKYIRKIIFSDKQKRLALEKIVHPKVRHNISSQLDSLTTTYCLIVIPLLIESNMHDLVDRICVVDTTPELQIKRIKSRDQCDLAQAKQILSSQLDRDTRLSHANDIIVNNGDLDDLNQQISKLHEKYLALCH